MDPGPLDCRGGKGTGVRTAIACVVTGCRAQLNPKQEIGRTDVNGRRSMDGRVIYLRLTTQL